MDDILTLIVIVIGILVTGLCMFAPAALIESHDNVQRLETYWEQSVEPYIIEDCGEYVLISCPEAGLWQAGTWTLTEYNEELRSVRRWATHPILNPLFNNAGGHLKYVSVRSSTVSS